MSLSAANVLILYRHGNSDSLEFAQYYAALHSLDQSQILGIPCSGNEILSSYNQFKTEIEIPVEDAILSEYGGEYGFGVIQCIIVGYGVPGGFRDGNDVIATTARLSRLGYPYVKKTGNPLFGRSVYQDYDQADAAQVIITSRIDGPTLDVAKKAVDSARIIIRQGAVNGSFFFDKDAVLTTADQQSYYDELSDFETVTLPTLNMKTVSTTHWDDQTDIPLFRLINDSIVWAWKTDRAGYTFFEESKPARVFCYNADTDGAGALRDANDKRWPMLALSSGYAATAGAMSDPTPAGYLIPKAFFETLLRGATLGEAFIYALPYLDWTVSLFGDPLIKCKFPNGITVTDTITELKGFELMSDNLANCFAYENNRNNLLTSLRNYLDTTDITVKGELNQSLQNLLSATVSMVGSSFLSSAAAFLSFPLEKVDSFLSDNQIKISQLIPLASSNSNVQSTNEHAQGVWKIETTIIRSAVGFFTYQFELNVSTDAAFNNIFVTANSGTSQAGWYFEKDQSIFTPMTNKGVTASYAGRLVRYVGQTTLPQAEIYYFRIRQINNFGEKTDWVLGQGVVNT